MEGIIVGIRPDDFRDWDSLLALLSEAFAGMEGRIDPPSSMTAMDANGLRDKAENEVLVLANKGNRLVGCGFGAENGDLFCLSKLAVRGEERGRGVLREMIGAFSRVAVARGLVALTLQTRVELVENHATFEALGFVRSGGTAHPGYGRITSWTYTKRL